MRKALIIIFASLIISSLVFIIYIFIPAKKEGKTLKKISFDRTLSYDNHDLMFVLLRKLGFMLTVQQYGYSMDIYPCIVIHDDWNESNYIKFRSWFGNKKRLIVFLNNPLEYDEKLFREISVSGEGQFLDGVKKVRVYGGGLLFNVGKIYTAPGMAEPVPILKDGRDVFIAATGSRGAEIILIWDESLFSDKNILKSDNAVLLNNLFREYYHKPIAFDLQQEIQASPPVNGVAEKLLFKGIFPYLLIQIILLGLIFFMSNFKRFGNILDFNKYKKRSLENHLSAVSNFYHNSGNMNVVSGILDDYFFEKLARYAPNESLGEALREMKRRYGGEYGTAIFERGNIADIGVNERQRMMFIKIMEKGENHGERF